MTDEAAAARLFPEAANPKPAPTPGHDAPSASRLFPAAAQEQADKAKAEQQAQPKPADAKPKLGDQVKPAQDAKSSDQPQDQANPAILKAAGEITSTLAEMGFDPAHADSASFGKLAAELGLKADGAKRLAAWDQQRSEAAWDKLAGDWHTEAKQDVLYSDNVSAGRTLIEEFGDDRLMDEVIHVGYGSHPAVLTFLGKIGRALEAARRHRR